MQSKIVGQRSRPTITWIYLSDTLAAATQKDPGRVRSDCVAAKTPLNIKQGKQYV
jgi:hypothetical protein